MVSASGAAPASWRHLVSRIRDDDVTGVEEFVETYRPGFRFLLRRYAGSEGLEPLVERTMQAAVQGIRQGRLKRPEELVVFLRRAIAQWRAINPMGAAAPDDDRSMAIEGKLRSCSARERDLLSRYYVHGQPLEQMLAETGAGEREFLDLKERVRVL